MGGGPLATAGEKRRTARREPSPLGAASRSLLVLLAVALLLPSRALWAQTTTLYATADTYLKSGAANQNVGTETVLRVQSSGSNRTLVRFDDAAIAVAVGSGSLVSATLELYVASNGNNWGSTGRTVDVHRLSASWTEAGATWSCPIDSNPSNSSADCSPTWGGGSFAAAPTASVVHTNDLTGWVQFDVAEDVAAFLSGTPDYGWILKKTDESATGEVQYTSRQGTAAQQPRLVLVVESAAIDETAPSLAFTQPTFPVIVNSQTPAIALQYADGGSGINPSTVHVLVDGQDITGTCSVGAASTSCVSPSLSAGDHVLSAQVSDYAGNQASATYDVEVLLGTNVTVTLGMRYDTYLQSGSPNQNQGAEAILRVRSSGNNRVLVVPDTAELFTVLGEEPLFSATLELYIESNGNNWGATGRTVDVHRVGEEWVEGETTWNCALDADTTNSQPDCETQWNGGAYEPLPTDTAVHTKGMLGWVQFDVTQDVHALRDGVENLGWIVRKTDEAESGEVEYGSKEGNAAHAPRLVLVLGPGGVDETPPALRVTAPSQPLIAGDSSPTIALAFQDTASGVDTASLQVLVDATDITASCTTSANAATCEPPSLPLGPHTITARISDTAGNEAALAYTFELFGGDGSTISILSATADNFLRAGAKNQNEGDETYLRVKSSGKNRALVRFSDTEITALGPTPVDRAILELYIEKNLNNWGTSGRTVELHRMTGDWTELGSTWNCAIDTNTTNAQPDCNPKWNGGTFDAAVIGTVLHTRGLAGWIQFDVTAEVNAFLAGQTNYGWIVKKADERLAGFVKYTSRQGTAGLHPRLVVAAGGTLPTATATPTLTPTNSPASTATTTATPTRTATSTSTRTDTATHTATPTATDTDTQTPTFTHTRTATATSTSTSTATDTPSFTATSTNTATPTATNTPTATDTPTDTPTPTSTPTDTATPTPTSTYTSTPTPTSTPVPPGFVVGEVFDDGNALPLGGVAAAGVGSQASGFSDGQGRYALSLAAGPQIVELTKDGYTRNLRAVEVAPNGAASARDARLSALADPSAVDTGGGTVMTSYSGPAGIGVVELEVPPGAVGNGSEIRLTVLSPQALVFPVPLGWSVLLGADVRSSASTGTGTILRIPFDLVLPAASLPVVAAVWNEQSRSWIGGPPVTAGPDFFSIELPGLAASTQVALLVADSTDLEAVEGDPLPSAAPAAAVDPSGLVVADPEVIFSGPDARSHVFAEVFSAAPLVSGTLIEARLNESYDRLDGSKATGAVSRQDIATYRVSVTSGEGGGGTGALAAHFAVGPSLMLSFSELLEGRIRIDTVISEAGEPAVLEADGGSVAGPGVTLMVPPGAAASGTIVGVDAVSPSDLPAGANPFAAFNLSLGAGSLDAQAEYRLDLGTSVSDGDAFVIGRTILSSGRLVLQGAAFGRGESGLVVVAACEMFSTGQLCLAGFGSAGSYALFRLPSGLAAATGVVRDPASLPAAGLIVESVSVPVVAITQLDGSYVLPLPAAINSVVRARDLARDLSGTVSVAPPSSMPPSALTGDIDVATTPPEVVQIAPPNHGSGVQTNALITIDFSEALDPATVSAANVTLASIALQESANVAIRISLSADAKRLVLTPSAQLEPDKLYRIDLTSGVRDRAGASLAPFQSDFTTAAVFKADALPPNTLRVSLPDEDGNVIVCGGPQLALPGTEVVVENGQSGLTVTTAATDFDGTSGSAACDSLFPGRCNTDLPGSFCAVIEAVGGDRILAHVEDALGNTVTLDAGNMRDEVTGATMVGPDGGAVLAVDDPRYRLDIPEGAFEEVRLVTITPLGVDDFPHSADETLAFIGAAFIDLGGGPAAKEIDFSVPAPADATEEDQYACTRAVNFRGVDEVTMVDTASVNAALGLLTTDSFPFPGVLETGLYGLQRWLECVGFVSGFTSMASSLIGAGSDTPGFIPGSVFAPFPLHTTSSQRFTVPVPCNQAIDLTLNLLTGDEVDRVTLPRLPQKGEFVFLDQEEGEGLFADNTAPEVVDGQTSIPEGETNVTHDRVVSIPFSEPVLTSSLTPENVKLICTVFGVPTRMKGIWTQSADGKRIFFTSDDGQPLRGLPLGSECRVEVSNVKDVHGNVMEDDFQLTFYTFSPGVISRNPSVNAQAVALVGWKSSGTQERQYVAFAEGLYGDDDSAGGIAIIDHTSLATPSLSQRLRTAGIDRDVLVVDSGFFIDKAGTEHFGPFLMSIDGPGAPNSQDRLGVWRLYSMQNFPNVTQLVARAVNHSSNSLEQCASTDPQTLHLCNTLFPGVPKDQGIPLSLASIGADAVYVANQPHIGLEVIKLDGIDTEGPALGPIDGMILGRYFAVDTIEGWVVAVGQEGLIITDAGFNQVPLAVDYAIPAPGRGLKTLEDWPVDLDRNGTIEDDEILDLVVAWSQPPNGLPSLYVVAIDTEDGEFAPGVLEGRITLLPSSFPKQVFADRERRLLYVANGTTGLTVVDFQDPSGSLDADTTATGGTTNLVDDRVLANIPLETGAGRAFANDVTADVTLDAQTDGGIHAGHVIGFVAAKEDGWFWVDLGPGRLDTRLVRYASEVPISPDLVEPAEVDYFNERRTSLHQIEVDLPGRLVDFHDPFLDVLVEAVEWDEQTHVTAPTGTGFSPSVSMSFAPTSVTVQLTRVPGTSRYEMSRDGDGLFEQALVFSNLPLDEIFNRMDVSLPDVAPIPLYAGVGSKIRLTPQLGNSPNLQGNSRVIPVEKLDVVVVGIDGLRQDALYPPSENEVSQIEADYYVDPSSLSGIGQILGGVPGGGGVTGDLDRHYLRLHGVSAVFPSITLASWASIFTGKPPSLTGILGNEFFMRDRVAGLPGQREDGIVTLSEGAFDQSLLQIRALVPPAGATFSVARPEDLPTAQNDARVLKEPGLGGAETIFETLRTGTDDYLIALRERYSPNGDAAGLVQTRDDVSFMVWNHYSRGASKWVTMSNSQLPLFLASTIYPGESEALDLIPELGAGVYLNKSLRHGASPALPSLAGQRNDRPFPAFSAVYYPGLDHEAHDGHGVDGGRYRDYLQNQMDATVGDLADELRDLGEFHNKIFIVTTDHGHTRVTDDENEITPCKLDLDDMDEQDDRDEERKGNANLHIWELARIMQQGKELLHEIHDPNMAPAFAGALAISEHMTGRDELKNSGDLAGSAVGNGADNATVVAALNGPMAHVYVRSAPGWSFPPEEKDVGVVAELLRLALMGGEQFKPDGTRAFAPTKNAAFGAMDRERQGEFLMDIDLERLTKAPPSPYSGQGAIDFILIRHNEEYVVFNGLEPDPLADTPSSTPEPTDTPTPAPTSTGGSGGDDTPEPTATQTSTPTATPTSAPTIKIRYLTLDDFFALDAVTKSFSNKDHYVQAVKRIREMNRIDRSGDIVLVMRSRSDEPSSFRYTTGVACKGWHASLNRSDSYVPLILSYPGGNRYVLEEIASDVCLPGEGPRDCTQSKVVPELAKGVYRKEYFP